MEPTDPAAWYVRFRGRVTGPYGRDQLDDLRKRGQLSRFHEVSTDRQSWTSAASLFPQPQPAQPKYAPKPEADNLFVPVEDPTYPLTRAEPAVDWYYARDGSQAGPVGIDEIRRLASVGLIQGETLVWSAGMAAWTPAREVPDLFPVMGPPPGQFSPHAMAVGSHSGPPGAFHLDLRGTPAVAPAPTQVSGLAVASLVLGIVWLYGLGSLLAAIFGSVALSQIGRSNGRLLGRGMAIAGLVLGIVGMVPALFALGVVSLLGTMLR